MSLNTDFTDTLGSNLSPLTYTIGDLIEVKRTLLYSDISSTAADGLCGDYQIEIKDSNGGYLASAVTADLFSGTDSYRAADNAVNGGVFTILSANPAQEIEDDYDNDSGVDFIFTVTAKLDSYPDQ